MAVLDIAANELRRQFLSPLAWIVLAVVQALLAYVFLVQVERFLGWQPRLALAPGAPGVTELVVIPLFKTAAFLFLVVVPLLTMRVFTEERRAGTLPLLLSAPLSMTQIVLGKLLGLAGLLACLVALAGTLPLTLLAGTSLDPGLYCAGMLGLALVTLGIGAAGMFISTLTSQPLIAVVSTLGLSILLWILDAAARGQDTLGLFSHIGLGMHLDTLLRGIVDTRDLVYFALFVCLFTALSISRLRAIRFQH